MNISENRDIFKNYLSEYFIYFMDDTIKYFNELAYLTIINESYYLESSCNLSICNLNSTLENELNNSGILSNTTRRLEENRKINISKYFRNIPKMNKSNLYYKTKIRKLLKNPFERPSPSLSEDDITIFSRDIQSIT
jgi:hypothetical protein